MLATRLRRLLLFAAVTASALFVYVPRTYRALSVMGDSAELVAAGATWGVPHPPGYPLYTLIAHILTRLPAWELPFRVHLSSAVFHAVTVGVVACIIELLTGSVVAALVGGATLALGRIFFLGSLYTEVFPLNDLLFALLLWFAIHVALAEKNDQATPVRWGLPAAVLGLSLAHHPMIVLALPAVGVLVGPSLSRDVRRRRRALIGAVAGAVAPPLFFYALIPIAASRHPLPSWGNVHDLGALVHLMTRQDYGGVAHASRRLVGGQLLERLDAVAAGTAQSFGFMGALLVLVGAHWALRRERRSIGVALVTALLCSGPLFAALNALDIHSEYRVAFFERFLTMSHVACGVLVGLGAGACERWLSAIPRMPRQAGYAAVAVVAVGAVLPLLFNLALLDCKGDRRGSAYAHDLLDATPDGALVLLKSDMASQAALYACGVENRCGDRIVVTPGQLWMPWKRNEIARRYPALSLPPEGAVSVAHALALQNLASRAVFVHPELVDDVVHGELSILPSLLLFRVYPDGPSLSADLPRFRTLLDDLALGLRCEGCPLVKAGGPAAGADAQLRHIYDAAARAHVTAALQLEWPDEARALSSALGQAP